MATLKIHKVVSLLPNPLEPNAIYAVRSGQGFDLYISDATGSVAHKINSSGGGGWDFVSAEVPLAYGTVIKAAHGLGATPSDWMVAIRCKVADRDYSPGDEIQVNQFYDTSQTSPITPWADALEVGFSLPGSGNGGGFYINNKNNTSNSKKGLIDITKWVAVFRARA